MQLNAVWKECTPRKDVMEGKLLASELALSLASVVWGGAKSPYDSPKSFFESTYPTSNLKIVLTDMMRRLVGRGDDVNPVIVFDVGFGGGKTHTLAALYYAVKYGAPNITPISPSDDVKTIVISGEDVDSKGFLRGKTQIKTLWGDMFYQLGKYEKYKDYDSPAQFPGKNVLLEAMGDSPVLILIDELPKYLDAIGIDPDFLNRTVHFLQSIVFAVSSKHNAAVVMALAEDAFKIEADRAKLAVREAVAEALRDISAVYKRQQIEIRPVQDEDAVHVLKKRLFETISSEGAKTAADSYHELYVNLPTPQEFKKESFRDELERCYPFHPDLIKVFYERISTLDGFQRTRGALRLLTAAIGRIWKEKENDAIMIHPFHIDLADESIANDLTIRIGEQKYRNALESDVYNSMNSAVAQMLDNQSSGHWHAPLARRTCNTIYLFSLSAGKSGDKGIRQDALSTLIATPGNREYYLRVRDTILNILLEESHFIERQGERLLFVKEPSLIKLIQNHARDVSFDSVMNVIRDTAATLFSGGPDWMAISKIFVNSVSDLADESTITVAILNPIKYSTAADKSSGVPEEFAAFLKYKDNNGKKARMNINSVFCLVAEESQKQSLFSAAQKLIASREIEYEPDKFGVTIDRKIDIAKYRAEQESNLNDAIRATFTNILYMEREGPKFKSFNPAGYSKGHSGKEVLGNLFETLHRVLTKPFDPEYILIKAWPYGSKSTLVVDLYNKFFRVPELGIPVSIDIYTETLRKGVIDKLWILKTDNRIMKSDNIKDSIVLTEKMEIILFEEAERLNLLVDSSVDSSSLRKPLIDPGGSRIDDEQYVNVKDIPFSDNDLIVIAESLPSKMKPNYNKVMKLEIITQETPMQILSANFILIQMIPDKDCHGFIHAELERYNSPEYSLSITVSKDDLTSEIGKKTVELGRQFLEPSTARVTLSLTWNDGITVDEAQKILKEYDGGHKLIGAVNATVSR